jgi:hypothetical protein
VSRTLPVFDEKAQTHISKKHPKFDPAESISVKSKNRRLSTKHKFQSQVGEVHSKAFPA